MATAGAAGALDLASFGFSAVSCFFWFMVAYPLCQDMSVEASTQGGSCFDCFAILNV